MNPNVHPFPARMAPEIVEYKLPKFRPGSTLLDPMMGSGTFVLGAAARGHNAIGMDSDPLALIITEAAAGNYDHALVAKAANNIVKNASQIKSKIPASTDQETQEFIDFWFDARSRDQLASLAHLIKEADTELQAPLWCGFSRLIITKDKGASRARDVSHSRPHRVRDFASFDPFEKFVSAVTTVLKRANSVPGERLTLLPCDARALPLPDNSIDGILTSPPYLIAIDYLRGHRLSLVWMGHTIGELRTLRGSNVGAERGSDLPPFLEGIYARSVQGNLDRRKKRILNTYLSDVHKLVAEQSRVLRPNGTLTYVVANAQHGDSSISVEKIIELCVTNRGFSMVERMERQLPQQRRYLPPPMLRGEKAMDRRMHTEVVISFQKHG